MALLNTKFYNELRYVDNADRDAAAAEYIKKTCAGFSPEEQKTVYDRITSMHCNAVSWYPFKKGASVLELCAGTGVITKSLCESGLEVVAVEESLERAKKNLERNEKYDALEIIVGSFADIELERKFDYILLTDALKYADCFMPSNEPRAALLKKAASLLKDEGRLIVCEDNRMGAKYLCGAAEERTGRPYGGIRGTGSANGSLDKAQLKGLLADAGFGELYFYYPLPDHRYAQAVFSDERLPTQEDVSAVKPFYLGGSSLNFGEMDIWRSALPAGTFGELANSFIIEAAQKPAPEDNRAVYALFDNGRKDGCRISTVIYADGTAVVRPNGKEDAEQTKRFSLNGRELKERGISAAEYVSDGVNAVARLVRGVTMSAAVCERLLAGDEKGVYALFDRLYADIKRSSDEKGENLKKAYIDMLPSNCFVTGGEFSYFAQEWSIEDVPPEFVLFRAITGFYAVNEWANGVLPRDAVMEHYGIGALQQRRFSELERKFHNEITDVKADDFLKRHSAVMFQNRLERDNQILRVRLDAMTDSRDEILESKSWKITAPMRKLSGYSKTHAFLRVPIKYTKLLFKKGPLYTARAIKARLVLRRKSMLLVENNTLSKKQRAEQQAYVFKNDVKISVVVPLYNTPLKFLKQMTDSVLQQTYRNFELCLADGSSDGFEYVGEYCRSLAENDGRVRYKKLEENYGIAGNSNAALAMAQGGYIALLDHDDMIAESALFETAKCIEESGADLIYTDETTFSKKPSDAYMPHFKSDYNPDLLRGCNYFCHLLVFSRELLSEAGMFNSDFDGSQDYDMVLRLTEKAKNIQHIPMVLYYWRAHAGSVASDVSAKGYAVDAARRAIKAHLERVGMPGEVENSQAPSMYRVKYDLLETPLVSILIPSCDHSDDLRKCIESIYDKSSYRNFEIVVVENNSKQEATFEYYRELELAGRARIMHWDGEFNFSAINNFGVKGCSGRHVIFLNNDIEIITPEWIEEMLMYAQRPDVGAVGAKLYYPDDTIQHAGVLIGIGGVASHMHCTLPRDSYGYMSRAVIAQDLSACTAACIMVKRSVFDEIGGFDETFAVAFNDIDLCVKIRERGYLIVFTPFAEAYHYESKTRGYEDTDEKQLRFREEIERFTAKWGEVLERGDPYYNKNFGPDDANFGGVLWLKSGD